MSSIRAAVEAELTSLGVGGWRAETALSLASEIDEKPNASMARELRSLMTELGSTVDAVTESGDVGDDLSARREARIAAATGS